MELRIEGGLLSALFSWRVTVLTLFNPFSHRLRYCGARDVR
jgi:hypothetical protein